MSAYLGVDVEGVESSNHGVTMKTLVLVLAVLSIIGALWAFRSPSKASVADEQQQKRIEDEQGGLHGSI